MISVPSVAQFLARYPEFSSIDEDRIQALLVDSTDQINSGDWISTDAVRAILALTAHHLSLAMVQTSQVTGGTVAGPITQETVGPLSVSYKSGGSSSRGGVSNPVDLDETPYGIYYLNLRDRSFPPVAIV
jgi:hypothetical protein